MSVLTSVTTDDWTCVCFGSRCKTLKRGVICHYRSVKEGGICPPDTWAAGVAPSLDRQSSIVVVSAMLCHDATVSKHKKQTKQRRSNKLDDSEKWKHAERETPRETRAPKMGKFKEDAKVVDGVCAANSSAVGGDVPKCEDMITVLLCQSYVRGPVEGAQTPGCERTWFLRLLMGSNKNSGQTLP